MAARFLLASAPGMVDNFLGGTSDGKGTFEAAIGFLENVGAVASHMSAVVSSLAETSRVPSDEKAMELTLP